MAWYLLYMLFFCTVANDSQECNKKGAGFRASFDLAKHDGYISSILAFSFIVHRATWLVPCAITLSGTVNVMP